MRYEIAIAIIAAAFILGWAVGWMVATEQIVAKAEKFINVDKELIKEYLFKGNAGPDIEIAGRKNASVFSNTGG